MATKPVQINSKLHKKLKMHSLKKGETMGQTVERCVEKDIKG